MLKAENLELIKSHILIQFGVKMLKLLKEQWNVNIFLINNK